MIGEVDILGVFIPALLWVMLIAYAISFAIRKALSYTRFYEYVWHRSIFDLGLYVIVLGIVVSFTHR